MDSLTIPEILSILEEKLDPEFSISFRSDGYIIPSDIAVRHHLDQYFPDRSEEVSDLENKALDMINHFNGLGWSISYATLDNNNHVLCYINDNLDLKYINPITKEIYKKDHKILILLMP